MYFELLPKQPLNNLFVYIMTRENYGCDVYGLYLLAIIWECLGQALILYTYGILYIGKCKLTADEEV